MRGVFPFAALLLVAACAEDEDAHDPAAEACEAAEAAGTSLLAAATLAEAAAATITASETAWSVVLADEGGGVFSGFLSVEGSGEMLLFADTADVVTSMILDGTDEGLPEPAANEDCPDLLPEHWDLELTDLSLELQLGPAAVDGITLVLVPAEGHVH